MGTTIIIGMASATVASALTQIIMKALGKMDESMVLDFVTKSLIVATSVASFIKVISAIKSMY